MAIEPTNDPVSVTSPPTKKPSPPTASPTNQPTQKCGNGFCEISEQSSSCPVDCSNRELSVVTDSTKGAPGIMFSIKAYARDIGISAFKFFSWSTTASLVQIYKRAGKYTGFEFDPSQWELVYEETVQLNSDADLMTELNLMDNVAISLGSTQSFFIWISNGNMKYEAGTSEGSLLDSDDFIELYEGIGLTSKFTGSSENIYNPRIFTGIVRYEVLCYVFLYFENAVPISPVTCFFSYDLPMPMKIPTVSTKII